MVRGKAQKLVRASAVSSVGETLSIPDKIGQVLWLCTDTKLTPGKVKAQSLELEDGDADVLEQTFRNSRLEISPELVKLVRVQLTS